MPVAAGRRLITVLVAGAALLVACPLAAQSLGTFTWQLQPFCNRVTVTIIQNGGICTLDGSNDQCGGSQRAPFVGDAGCR